MSDFIKTLLSLSVSGTLLSLVIWGCKPLYQNKFSRRWQYYIWMIALLRFLLPVTPDTTIVGSLFEKFNTAITATADESPNAPVTVNADNSENVWLALALVLFVRKITIYRRFIRYIKAGNTEVSDIRTLNLLSDCKEKWNIKARVRLYHNALITSPLMIGLFRPSIILPASELEDSKLSYIFLHELTHYKRRDLFYKWLIQIVICVHWFNPFVHLLGKEINKACELSCDEAVISLLDSKARREYGDMLISFMRSDHMYKNSFAAVTLTEGAEQLKERLGAIMNFKKKSKTVLVVTAIFTAAVCFCFIAVGAYVAPSTRDIEISQGDADSDEIREENIGEMLEEDRPENNNLMPISTLTTVYVQSQGEYYPIYIYGILPERMQKTNNAAE